MAGSETTVETGSASSEESVAMEARVEAVLMTADRSVSTGRLVELTEASSEGEVTGAIERLNEAYELSGRVFRIERVASGWQVLTTEACAEVVARAAKSKAQGKLSATALETLSVIAYRQPVMRAEVETIRGVGCGEVIRQLMERQLVKVVGRAEEVGRPMLYGTTKRFLEVFGLASLKDLPNREALVPKRPAAKKPVDDEEKGEVVGEGDRPAEDGGAEVSSDGAAAGDVKGEG
ncbi:SMC-Scp complex subunit ScpB [Mucisphaera sp.]|uniref:SMC-Scp complex subunit ScpB n=1 Tax=Mucisphaera sp. TaxID=2913024 RepID=UPI003D10B184